LEDLKVRV